MNSSENRFPADNISVSSAGHLAFAGMDTVELAAEYGTPLYLMDAGRIRANCRRYIEALKSAPAGSMPLYAGKACAFSEIYRIMKAEGMGIDVVSPGEVYTAHRAGFPMEKAFFHGNNKTDADIAFAMDCGTGYFVTDNPEELYAVEAEAARRGITQKILLRITPGIDPHTYDAVSTGKVDSKFGQAIATGAAESITRQALSCRHVRLCGFHCHVGSQVFGEDVFERAVTVMLEFAADMNKKTGFVTEILDIGGGIGTRYVSTDPESDISAKVASIVSAVKAESARLGVAVPALMLEPGRSIVADAGMTLYTAGTVKRIPEYKTYVSVDGGMTDNPRYALYRSKYTVLAAGRAAEEADMQCTLAGRCCESGDIIQEGIFLPSSVRRGDIIAVCTTGAYNYSMASNYNRIPRPPVVMLENGRSYVAVKRESFARLTEDDI